jgi:Zn-dependent protease with chaperone function
MVATMAECAWREQYETEVRNLSNSLDRFVFAAALVCLMLLSLGAEAAAKRFASGALIGLTSIGGAIVASVISIGIFFVIGLQRRWIRYPVLRAIVFFFVTVITVSYVSDFTILAMMYLNPDSFRTVIHSVSDAKKLFERNQLATSFIWEPMFLSMVLAVGWYRIRVHHQELASARYLPFRHGQSPELWSLLNTIIKDARRDGFTFEVPTMLLKRTDSELLPSAIRGADGYQLAIPRQFFQIIRQSPNRAKAILAHELAHIAQQNPGTDAKLDYVRGLLLRAFWGFFALTVIGQSILNVVGGGFDGPNLITLILAGAGCYVYVVAQRYCVSSELLADRFAARYGDVDGLIEAVEAYTGGKSAFHPTKASRILAIRRERRPRFAEDASIPRSQVEPIFRRFDT